MAETRAVIRFAAIGNPREVLEAHDPRPTSAASAFQVGAPANATRFTLEGQRSDHGLSRGLRSPLWLAALGVLLLNDHVLKQSSFAGVVTGKLSDVAGLIVAPLVLAVLLGVRSRRAWATCNVAVVGVFAAMQIFPSVAQLVDHTMSTLGFSWRTTPDPTDLLAIPAAFIAANVFSKYLQCDHDHARPRTAATLWTLLDDPGATSHLRAKLSVAAQCGATALGFAACLATSVEKPTAPFDGRVTMLNADDEPLTLSIRPLGGAVTQEECGIWTQQAQGAQQPAVQASDFAEASEIDVAPWGLIELTQGEPGTCGAILMTSADLVPTVLLWSSDRVVRRYESWAEGDLETYVNDGVREIVHSSQPSQYWLIELDAP